MPVVRKQGNGGPRPKGVLGRIAPIKLAETGLKINIYGKSGTGKTTIACTFPKPLLLIGAEDGTRSVHNVRGVDFVRLENSSELSEIISISPKYATVVLDAASSLQDMILKEILGVEALPAQGSWGMATREQWGQCAVQTKERLRELLLLQSHVVILAQEREFNAEESSSSLLSPYVASAMSPSVVGWLNPMCDYICQAFIRQEIVTKRTKIGDKVIDTEEKTDRVEYCLRTAPHEVYTTKFRLPKGSELPQVIVDPSYAKIQEIIGG